MGSARQLLQEMYKTSDLRVRKADLSPEGSLKKYSNYLSFVSLFKQENKSLLDIGCGTGWSSYHLSQLGIKVTGMDLHSDSYEPSPTENLKFMAGDAQEIPHPDESFNIVSTNECLEHIPSPQKALSEMARVTKKGGYIIIIGPNLLSLGMSFKALTKYVWMHRPISRVLFRDKDLPYHPLGNTLFEVLFYFLRNSFLIPIKYLFGKPNFLMRKPDLRPPFHADSDSCYLLNPLDIKNFFKDSSKYEIIQSGPKNRSKYLECIASGTWMCIKKL